MADSTDSAGEYWAFFEDRYGRIEAALSSLPVLEAQVLRGYFGLGRVPLPIREIADHLDLAESEVRQLTDRGLAGLRRRSPDGGAGNDIASA